MQTRINLDTFGLKCMINHEEHEAPFGLHEGGKFSVVIHGHSPSANVITLRHEGWEHSRTWGPGDYPLAAGGMLFL